MPLFKPPDVERLKQDRDRDGMLRALAYKRDAAVQRAAAEALIEWGHALGDLGPVDRVSNALFQAATLRTAGFNSIDIAAVQPATLTVMMVMMFIGGSPGSTAGGVKTTTIAVLTLMIYAALMGRTRIRTMGFSVHQQSVYKSVAVATLALLGILALRLLKRANIVDF